MVEELVPDDLWQLVQHVVPLSPPRPRGGRPQVAARRTFAGILYVLRWGLPWRQLPLALGFGSGRTCERRFDAWTNSGVWANLMQIVLNHAAGQNRVDWSRSAVDSASVPAPRGGEGTGRNPTDRGKRGSKLHLIVDGEGVPLGVTVSAANLHDSQQLEATLDAIPRVSNGRPGRPKHRPRKVHADKGYDYERCRQAIRRRGMTPRIARRGIDSSGTLGRYRWRVERTLSWLLRYRRVAVRRDRMMKSFLGWCELACAMVIWKQTKRLSIKQMRAEFK